ncbi:TylF/MycF family methyltransferase [Mesorhizobium sp. B2-3-10]|uniref:TylF/MycF family methyltransferase n=1 Tax=Mesorhizobium sp. B2-3-10 TaxID=2589954 RepID=UPI001FEF7939|nr:TylF/MycF family methyltransferase [Mesorhizobium sp. B2-3-10]
MQTELSVCPETEWPSLRRLPLCRQSPHRHGSSNLAEKLAVDTLVGCGISKKLGQIFTDLIRAILPERASTDRISIFKTLVLIRRRTLSGSHDFVTSAMKMRNRYLNVLEASLTGTLYGDAPIDPWTGGKYDPNKRALGQDWPGLAQTMIGSARMRNLRHLCETVILNDVPGDFIETGVWRGGACIFMKAILASYADTIRRVFVADSFAGLPPPSPEIYAADAGDVHHTHTQLAISRKDVEDNFRRYDLLDEQVVFLEGWFKDTLPEAPIQRLAILRLDGDMYESTIQALDALYSKVSYGGFVIVDDYFLTPCAQAINEFRTRTGITSPLMPIDGCAVWWRVSEPANHDNIPASRLAHGHP